MFFHGVVSVINDRELGFSSEGPITIYEGRNVITLALPINFINMKGRPCLSHGLVMNGCTLMAASIGDELEMIINSSKTFECDVLQTIAYLRFNNTIQFRCPIHA